MHKYLAWFIFAVATLWMIAGSMAQGNCLPDGAPCQADGSMGNCCTTFCLQHEQPGGTPGHCTTRS
uniref:Putative antimicrobial knottin protein Btk-1 n=1 Tax=Bemisia tabaci TaxID=7038 RepID=Q2PQD0_BEMTA|nr:putative antimicrobial knottin protein Btk-1 [Bemisia tabaci]